jgi:glycosyltransferase involved in cell wall biosynthesis
MKALWRKRVVYDVFDFYAEMLRATPGIVKKLIRAVDLWAMGKADAVILADDSRRAQISGARPRKVEVIVNTPEDGRADTAGFAEAKPQWSQLHLVFVGLLQLERGLLEMLEVLSRHPEWSVGLAGFGGDKAAILDRAKGMRNVEFFGRVQYERALALSNAADVIVATYDPRIPNHRYSSPNKLFEAMMLGKPVVVAEHTNMDRLVRDYNCGLVVPYGDVEALEHALKRLSADGGLRKRLGAAGRKAYDEVFSWDIMAERLISTYTVIAG